MKVKSLSLSILAVSATTFATSQASLAADRSKFGDPRWEFDLQYCQGNEKGHQPILGHRPILKQTQAAVQLQPTVRPGSMPTSTAMGLPANLLAKPPAPAHAVAQPVVAAKTESAPQSFMKSFGNPVSIAPPVVAALPQAPQPLVAAPASAPNPRAKSKATTSTIVAWRRSGRPAALAAAPQKAMPKAQGYGQGFGYTSGATAPVVSSARTTTHTAVSAVIVPNQSIERREPYPKSK